jgi:hypothetical protein
MNQSRSTFVSEQVTQCLEMFETRRGSGSDLDIGDRLGDSNGCFFSWSRPCHHDWLPKQADGAESVKGITSEILCETATYTDCRFDSDVLMAFSETRTPIRKIANRTIR